MLQLGFGRGNQCGGEGIEQLNFAKMNPPKSQTCRGTFKSVHTAAVHDVLDELGHLSQTLPPEIVPWSPNMVVAGPPLLLTGAAGRDGSSIRQGRNDAAASVRGVREVLGT